MRYFARREPMSASVRYMLCSAAFAKDAGLKALVQMVLDEVPAQNAAARGPAPADCSSSWDIIENDDEGEQKGWRQRNAIEFTAYIKVLFKIESIVPVAIDWKAAGDATVVDLDGSAGHDDIALSKAYPDLKIACRTFHKWAPYSRKLPANLRSCVLFLARSPQPVPADNLHLQVDSTRLARRPVGRHLKALVSALKPGARVVPISAWKQIFGQADEKYQVSNAKADPLTFIFLMEATWRG
ncbi:hypothetical protein MGG_15777 [Pyricularia oryzae 70-15]|uniref:Uncharacterized protein n=4 Tax=Pyricularia oryzae TaxID=318829 RepID=G4MW67_PYRO7|nr:uncharacterized protein MGG_15777 [Pyricularia oryzae 70-15]EHA55028.1 hypothetical protein MGG_15777 [Pyricularia oryzae 70-15]ELQ36771.1 hypothetical protein OOU_Y34scaffold00641g55 [Pyricularia oryzae Y34]